MTKLTQQINAHVTSPSLMPSELPPRMAAVLTAHPDTNFTLVEDTPYSVDCDDVSTSSAYLLTSAFSLVAKQPLTPLTMSAVTLANAQFNTRTTPVLSVTQRLNEGNVLMVVKLRLTVYHYPHFVGNS